MAKQGKLGNSLGIPPVGEIGKNLIKQAVQGNKALQAVTPKPPTTPKPITLQSLKIKNNNSKTDSLSPWR